MDGTVVGCEWPSVTMEGSAVFLPPLMGVFFVHLFPSSVLFFFLFSFYLYVACYESCLSRSWD